MKTKRLSLLIAVSALACFFLTGGNNVFAGDKDDHSHSKADSSEYRSGPRGLIDRISEKRRKIHKALLDHHRRERAFIIGLVTGGDRRYHGEEEEIEEYYDDAAAPAHEYSQPAPVYRPAPAPAPAPEKKTHKYKYPGYSGY